MANKVLLGLIIPVALLLVLGIIMQGSISPVISRPPNTGPYFFLWNQLKHVGIGLCILLIAQRMDYRKWQKLVPGIYLLVLVLLALCLVKGIGLRKNGAARWIQIGIQFQPSELAKLVCVFAVAAWCVKWEAYQRDFTSGFLYPLLIILAPATLIATEVDLGNCALLFTAGVAVMFVAGSKFRYIILSALTLIIGAIAVIKYVPAAEERIGRLTDFLDLQSSKSDNSWQQWRSLIALGTAGVWGLGLGGSVIKHKLTFCNSDFIFPIIGEEMGMVASIGVVVCYLSLCICGILISMHAADRFGKLVAFGFTTIITSQAILHIGVCLGVLPNKGTALPFVSAGGTSIMLLMGAIGVLLSIYRKATTLVDADRGV